MDRSQLINEFDLEEDENATKKKNVFNVSRNLFILLIVIGLLIFLITGLLSGFLLRKCIEEELSGVISTTPQNTKISSLLTTLNKVTTTITEDIIDPNSYDFDRIPDYIIPTHYYLSFKLDFDPSKPISDNDGFEGYIEIDFQLNKKTRELIFHADNASLRILDPIKVINLETNDMIQIFNQIHTFIKNQLFLIRLDNELEISHYKIIIDFESSGSLLSEMGVFTSEYSENGDLKTMVATKFEPTDARKAFPCFDEPNLKATFDISIEHPLGTYALSNFDVKKITIFNETFNPDKYIKTEFETTFKMSTYLVAWAIVPNDFAYKQVYSQNGKPVRVYARANAVNNGLIDFALSVAKQSLDYFENEYFSMSDAVPPKIDLIAIPEFPSGAMEHWGLIGFRETRLLFSETENSVVNKQNVAFAIAHELAHFWFGNLVTCKWNDLWLNEAMATFLQYKVINKLFPDWDIDEQTIIEDTLPVMWDDAFESSHPVEVNVTTPDQINNVFDSITYSKGAALLRMLESVVGEDGFKNGLKNYLENNKFGSGIASDFYNTLQLPNIMNSITDVEQFINTWLRQMNYPIVSIELKQNNNGKSKIIFMQDRFLLNEVNEEANPLYTSPYNYIWQIHMSCEVGGTYDFQNGNEQHLVGDIKKVMFFLNTIKAELELDRAYTWIKCNKDFKSFYLTDYKNSMFDTYADLLRLKPNIFSVGDRAYLLHTSYMLAYLGIKSYSVPSLLSSYLQYNETHYVPWNVFTYHVDRLANILEHRPAFYQLSTFGDSIASVILLKYNIWDDNGTHLEKLLKTIIVEFLCRLQNQDCLLNATNEYNKIPNSYFLNPNQIINTVSANIRSTVYKYHIQNTYNYEDWFNLFKVYNKSIDPQEQSIVLSALSYTRSTWLLNSYLNKLLKDKSDIKKQDFFTVINKISSNPAGRYLSWYWIREYWNEIVKKFGIENRAFGRSLKIVCETFENKFLYNEMKEFFIQHPNAGAGENPRQQAVDIVISNIFWVNDREHDIVNYLFGPLKY